MSAFKPLWDRGELAIVHATGSHDTTRSHFDAQDYMESATPGVKSTRDGWLNRYLQGSGAGIRASDAQSAARHRADQADAARAAGHGAGAGDRQHRGLHRRRHERADVVRRDLRGRQQDKALRGTAGEAFDAMRRSRRRPPASIGRPTARRIRARRSARRCRRSRGSRSPTSASRSRSPKARSGITTSTRARRPDRSPIASTTSRAASPLSPRTLAIAWPTPSS